MLSQDVLINILENTIASCRKNLDSVETLLNYIKLNKKIENITCLNSDCELDSEVCVNKQDDNHIQDFEKELDSFFGELESPPNSLDLSNIHPFDEDLWNYRNSKSDGYENSSHDDLKELENVSSEDKPLRGNNIYVPTIDPLLTITPSERNALTKQIFKEAVHNVKYLIQGPNNNVGVEETHPEYTRYLYDEADRLLNVWRELRKAKKI